MRYGLNAKKSTTVRGTDTGTPNMHVFDSRKLGHKCGTLKSEYCHETDQGLSHKFWGMEKLRMSKLKIWQYYHTLKGCWR